MRKRRRRRKKEEEEKEEKEGGGGGGRRRRRRRRRRRTNQSTHLVVEVGEDGGDGLEDVDGGHGVLVLLVPVVQQGHLLRDVLGTLPQQFEL